MRTTLAKRRCGVNVGVDNGRRTGDGTLTERPVGVMLGVPVAKVSSGSLQLAAVQGWARLFDPCFSDADDHCFASSAAAIVVRLVGRQRVVIYGVALAVWRDSYVRPSHRKTKDATAL